MAFDKHSKVTDILNELQNLSGINQKEELKAVLISKGLDISDSDSITDMIIKANNIIVANGNAQPEDVIEGKTFSNYLSNNLVGTLNLQDYISNNITYTESPHILNIQVDNSGLHIGGPRYMLIDENDNIFVAGSNTGYPYEDTIGKLDKNLNTLVSSIRLTGDDNAFGLDSSTNIVNLALTKNNEIYIHMSAYYGGSTTVDTYLLFDNDLKLISKSASPIILVSDLIYSSAEASATNYWTKNSISISNTDPNYYATIVNNKLSMKINSPYKFYPYINPSMGKTIAVAMIDNYNNNNGVIHPIYYCNLITFSTNFTIQI